MTKKVTPRTLLLEALRGHRDEMKRARMAEDDEWRRAKAAWLLADPVSRGPIPRRPRAVKAERTLKRSRGFAKASRTIRKAKALAFAEGSRAAAERAAPIPVERTPVAFDEDGPDPRFPRRRPAPKETP